MKYTEAQFIEDVKKEARAIRKHATEGEISRLDPLALNPRNMERCIYGQMTGNCRNERAVALITKCCKRFIDQNKARGIPTTLNDVKRGVNGTKSEKPNSVMFLSSIESYIAIEGNKNKNLIAYLKGERNDLVL